MSKTGTRILAVGAAGKFAGLVVPELVKRGAIVRGLTTTADHEEEVKNNGAQEVAIGDLSDKDGLWAALDGVDSIFYISPVFAADQAEMGRNMVEAAQGADVRRIVFSSVIHPILTAIDNHAAKAPIEEAIVGSDLEYTILHPTLFYENYATVWPQVAKTGVFAEPYSADSRIGRVDYRDVAEVAAIALTEDRLLYGTFELCAEGNYDRHEVAAIMSDVLGREIRAERVPFEDWAEKAGIPKEGPVRSGLKQMYAWYDTHGFVGNALTLRAILGCEPRTLRAYFEELSAGDRSL
ncbi:NmrA family NAD(P)-binding protein [Pararhizobium mangrovi]|uniref:NmrA family NAD(P)-binding protein n=1 Tax=Pararhizobium mangrovi TaxID=2590452 RepID=UPI001F3117C6|nr:NmrA family NAD(P)-binding protein [Pararhizobium mangrovi]